MEPICPHCGHRPFGLWYKMILGPARSVACGWCGQKIGVKMVPALCAMVPAVVLLVSGYTHLIVQRDSLVFGAIAAGLAAFAIYPFVPLEKRRATDFAALERTRAEHAEPAGSD